MGLTPKNIPRLLGDGLEAKGLRESRKFLRCDLEPGRRRRIGWRCSWAIWFAAFACCLMRWESRVLHWSPKCRLTLHRRRSFRSWLLPSVDFFLSLSLSLPASHSVERLFIARIDDIQLSPPPSATQRSPTSWRSLSLFSLALNYIFVTKVLSRNSLYTI